VIRDGKPVNQVITAEPKPAVAKSTTIATVEISNPYSTTS
jgi:hypothetical protein